MGAYRLEEDNKENGEDMFCDASGIDTDAYDDGDCDTGCDHCL